MAGEATPALHINGIMKLLTLIYLLALSQVSALTIIRTFTGGDTPTNTIGAGNLPDIFNAAADVWELCYPHDDHVLHLEYGWGSVGSAVHHGLAWENGRETHGRITVDNQGEHAFDWFLDPTPYASEEYDDFRLIRMDLGGGAIVTGKGLVHYLGATRNTLDLFTILEHEIGHGLGLSASMPNWLAESEDGIIHVRAPLPYVGTEFVLARNCCEIQPHIFNDGSWGPIMHGTAGGERKWPSWADILAIAQMSGWRKPNLDLQPVLRVLPYPALEDFLASEGRVSGVDFPGARMEVRYGQYGGYISITNQPDPFSPTNSGSARYTFYAPQTAEYTVRALVRALDESSNSLWIDIDAEPVAPSATWHMAITEDYEWRTASWQGAGDLANPEFAPKTWRLEPGPHELVVVGRERGCEILDLRVVCMEATRSPSAGITLDWSAHCKGYAIESAPSISGPWQKVDTEATFLRGRYVAPVLRGLDATFFRLSKEVAP